MGGIRNPDLYRAVYDAALAVVERRDVPTKLLPAGASLFRGVEARYLHQIGAAELVKQRYVTVTSARRNIVVRDQEDGDNRYSGAPCAGVQVKMGGCYFFLTESAGLAEMMHYKEREIFTGRGTVPMDAATGRVSIPHLLATKAVLQLTLMSAKLVANLDPADGDGIHSFFHAVGNPEPVRKRLLGRTIKEMVNDPDDYSVSRAIGHALQSHPYLYGIYAPSVRQTERSAWTLERQSNVCLFGRNKEEIEGLRADWVFLFFEPGLPEYRELVKLPVEGYERS